MDHRKMPSRLLLFLKRQFDRFRGAEMNRAQVVDVIRQCMIEFVDTETSVEHFSFALVPQKRLAEGGLGATELNVWEGLLDRFQEDYLPPSAPFQNKRIAEPLAEKTHSLELETVCFEIADFLI